MSKRSHHRKRRAIISRRIGVKWDGHGRLMTMETPEQFIRRVSRLAAGQSPLQVVVGAKSNLPVLNVDGERVILGVGQ